MNRSYDYKKIFKLIDKVDLVSFDIFDTLIKRNIISPQNLFKKVQEIYNSTEEKKVYDYVENRKVAQKKARLDHINDDYNIDEVYLFLEKIYDKNIANKFLRLEKELEMKYCIKNFDFFPIYEYCVKKNKKIICISDMYFDEKFIKNILINNGYNQLDKIYISCDYRKRKAIGNLYDVVYKECSIKKCNWLHIGDSFKGDFLQPKIKGIKAYHIKTKLNNLDYFCENDVKVLDDEIIYSVLNNNVNYLTKNRIQKVGFEIFGPLFFGYIKWLKCNFDDKKIDKLFFCSRDMKIVYDFFSKYFPNYCSKYFYISRKSIRGAYLYKNNSLENFLELITEEELNIKQILKVLNVNINDVRNLLDKYNLKENSVINFHNVDNNFVDFYNSISYIIISSNESKYIVFEEYLKQEKFDGKVALIDTGWNATTQYCLSKLIDDVNIYGYYFGLEKKAYNRIDENKLNSYVFSPEHNQLFKDKINSFKIVFETIISHNINSVTGYEKKKSGIFPIFETDKSDTANYVEDVQRGIVESLNLILNFDYSLNIDMNFAISGLDRFIVNPILSDAKEFIVLKNKNFEKEKFSLGPQHKSIYYIFHPKKMYNEFHQSVWKTAYLKLLFKIKLPYYKIYIILKNRRDKRK